MLCMAFLMAKSFNTFWSIHRGVHIGGQVSIALLQGVLFEAAGLVVLFKIAICNVIPDKLINWLTMLNDAEL